MKDAPLKVGVAEDQLIITIGVDTLAFSDTQRTGLKITNPQGFAIDVMRALQDEDEIGASILTESIDSAMQRAADEGSEHIECG